MAPLDVFQYGLQAPGYSYRREALIGSLLISSWLIAILLYLSLLFFFLWLYTARKIRSGNTSNSTKKWESAFYYLFHIFFLLSMFTMTLLLLFPVMLDYMNVAIGIVFSILITSIAWALVSPRSVFGILRRKFRPDKYDPESSVQSEKKAFWKKPWKRPVWFWGGLIYCFLFGFLLNFFLEDVCFAVQPVEIDFKYTRGNDDTLCDYGPPCHVYLTFGDQMATSMIVNFQLRRRLKEGVVYYDTKPRDDHKDYRFKASSSNFVFVELEEDRYVYWVELHDLDPDSRYYFVAGGEPENPGDDKGKIWLSGERWFRTAPTQEPYVYVSGGDMGAHDATFKLTELAGTYDPLFIAVGGDISYANAFPACYRRWDKWFKMYDRNTRQNTEDKESDGAKRMVPMLLVIGNHEGGYLLDGDRDSFIFYFSYFVFQYGVQNKDLTDRSSYHKHLIGSETLLLSLDSGHLVNPKGQEDFIINTINEEKSRNHKLVYYHVPFWPATTWDPDGYLRKRLRAVWKPIFEEYQVDIAFQHHDHVYGRTKKLIGNEEFPYSSDEGVVYTNSGCMGVDPVTNEFNKRQMHRYIKLEKKRHFLVVHVERNEINCKAIGVEGNVFDEFTVHSDH